MRIFSIILSFLLIFNILSAGENPAEDKLNDIPKEKLEEIYKLLELTNISKEADETIQSLIEYFEQLAPHLPDNYLKDLAGQFSGKDYLKKLAPIYAKTFTIEEIEQLNSFFSSPSGEKFINSLQEISMQSYQAKQQWEAEMDIKIKKQLEEDGYIKQAKPLKNSGGENEK